MSKELKYKLYSVSDCIPEHTMFSYIDKKLTAREEHLVEKHLIDCELCCDALEGLQNIKDRTIVTSLNRQVMTNIPEQETNIFKIDYRLLLSAAAGVLLLIGAIFFFKNFSSSKSESIAEVKKEADPALASETTVSESTEALSTSPVVPAEENNLQEKPADEKKLSFPDNSISDVKSKNEITGSSDAVADDEDKFPGTRPEEQASAADLKSLSRSTTVSSPKLDEAAQAPPVVNDKNSLKDIPEQDDLSKESVKREENNYDLVLTKSAKEKNKKSETGKQQAEKELEQKPSVSGNSGYWAGTVSPDQNPISVDSTGIKQANDELIFSKVDVQPQYPGGEAEMLKYLQKNLKILPQAKENQQPGKTYVQFVIDKEGNIKNAKILKGTDPVTDKEVLKVINEMPKWIPGKSGGEAVNVLFNLPLNIDYR